MHCNLFAVVNWNLRHTKQIALHTVWVLSCYTNGVNSTAKRTAVTDEVDWFRNTKIPPHELNLTGGAASVGQAYCSCRWSWLIPKHPMPHGISALRTSWDECSAHQEGKWTDTDRSGPHAFFVVFELLFYEYAQTELLMLVYRVIILLVEMDFI